MEAASYVIAALLGLVFLPVLFSMFAGGLGIAVTMFGFVVELLFGAFLLVVQSIIWIASLIIKFFVETFLFVCTIIGAVGVPAIEAFVLRVRSNQFLRNTTSFLKGDIKLFLSTKRYLDREQEKREKEIEERRLAEDCQGSGS